MSVRTLISPETKVDAAEQVRGAWGAFEVRVDGFVDRLPIIGIALAIILVALLVAKLVNRLDAPFRLLSKSPLLRSVIRNIVSSVIFVTGVLIALEILDATKLVGTVLGAAGVLGLAVGFAFQDIVENYLASVLLAIRRPFAIRDIIQVGDHTGKVMSLTTRATVLLTIEGNHVRLPNSMVFKSVIVNFTRNPSRRFDFTVGAGTEEDLTAAQKLGVDTLLATPGVSDDPEPFSLVEELGDSSVAIRFHGWVNQNDFDFFKVRSESIRRVKVAFDNAEIQMPEPTYRIAMVEKSDAAQSVERAPLDIDAAAHDVSADHEVDRQIDREAAEDPEGENLLNE